MPLVKHWLKVNIFHFLSEGIMTGPIFPAPIQLIANHVIDTLQNITENMKIIRYFLKC